MAFDLDEALDRFENGSLSEADCAGSGVIGQSIVFHLTRQQWSILRTKAELFDISVPEFMRQVIDACVDGCLARFECNVAERRDLVYEMCRIHQQCVEE